MSDTITPIRDGVLPELDPEREMIDLLQTTLRGFKKDAGQPPTRIMIAVAGKGADGQFHSRANSWDTREETTKAENCGLAIVLFTQRALAND